MCNSWFHHHCHSQPDILANKPAVDPSWLLRWLAGLSERKLTRQQIKSAGVYPNKTWKIKTAYHCTYSQISNVKVLTTQVVWIYSLQLWYKCRNNKTVLIKWHIFIKIVANGSSKISFVSLLTKKLFFLFYIYVLVSWFSIRVF